MGRPGEEAATGWMSVRQDRGGGVARGILATLAILVAAVAGLALVDSFFLEPTPGTSGGPGGDEGSSGSTSGRGTGSGLGDGDGGGGDTVSCASSTRSVGIMAGVAAGLTGMFAVLAVVRGRALARSFMETAWGPSCLALATVTLLLLAALAFTAVVCYGISEGEGESGSGAGQGSAGGSGGSGSGGSDGDGDVEVPPPRLPDWGWILLILAIIAAVALLVYAASRWRPRKDGSAPGGHVHANEHKALRRILDRDELQSREAVIAAYRAFLAWADGHDLPRVAEDTTMEHAQRVAGRFQFPPDEMRGFVASYQVARLSERDPSPKEREQALRFSQQLPDRTEP